MFTMNFNRLFIFFRFHSNKIKIRNKIFFLIPCLIINKSYKISILFRFYYLFFNFFQFHCEIKKHKYINKLIFDDFERRNYTGKHKRTKITTKTSSLITSKHIILLLLLLLLRRYIIYLFIYL
jgi:hypothetical protein